MKFNDTTTVDRAILAATFAARIGLAKVSENEAAQDAREEHYKNLIWIESNAQRPGSFLWFCNEFDLDPGAVRKSLPRVRS